MREIKPDLISTLVGSAEVNARAPGHSYRVYWDSGNVYEGESVQLDSGRRVTGHAFRAEYLVGAGVSGYSLLFRRGDGLFEAPLSFFSRTRNWDLSPGFAAFDAGLTRPAKVACLECHIGRFAPGVEQTGVYPKEPFAEEAIGCESCHGPGELHVAERSKGNTPSVPDDSIVNPAHLTPELSNDICMLCHQGNDVRVLSPGKRFSDFRPGKPLRGILYIFKARPQSNQRAGESELLEHGFAMTLSKCFRGSNSMTCSTCHSVHRKVEPAEKVAFYRSKCLTCHSVTSCKLDAGKRRDDDCASCHMPKRAEAIVAHTALTNHRIVRVADEGLPELAYADAAAEPPGLIRVSAAPVQDGIAAPDIVLLQAYRTLLSKAPWLRSFYTPVLDRLKLTQPDNPVVLSAAAHELLTGGSAQATESAIALLEKAMKNDERDSESRLDLVDALIKQHRVSQAEGVLNEGIAAAPFDLTLRKMLISATMEAGDYSQSTLAMREYLEIYPADRQIRRMLDELVNLEGKP